MQARYYDPVIGRFYSNDPIGFRDVHSFNRYAYANNNPYKYTDPDGRESMFAFHADLDVKALGSGNITRGEFAARSNARSEAAVIPLVAAAVVATRGAAALPIIQKVKSEVKQEVVAQVLSAAIEIAANQVGIEGTKHSQNDGKLNGNQKRTENSSESISPEKSAKKDSNKEMRSKPQPPPKPRIKFKRR
jgi:uncharacterized protein RhaS with RHS repeats